MTAFAKTALLALAALGLTAATTPPPYGARAASPQEKLPDAACIKPARILNHTFAGDGHSFYVQVHGVGVYRGVTQGDCLASAMRSDGLVLLRTGVGADICRPLDARVQLMSGGHSRSCMVESLELLTPTEVAALPKAVRP